MMLLLMLMDVGIFGSDWSMGTFSKKSICPGLLCLFWSSNNSSRNCPDKIHHNSMILSLFGTNEYDFVIQISARIFCNHWIYYSVSFAKSKVFLSTAHDISNIFMVLSRLLRKSLSQSFELRFEFRFDRIDCHIIAKLPVNFERYPTTKRYSNGSVCQQFCFTASTAANHHEPASLNIPYLMKQTSFFNKWICLIYLNSMAHLFGGLDLLQRTILKK